MQSYSFAIDASKFIAPLDNMISKTQTTTVKVETLQTAVSAINGDALAELQKVAQKTGVPIDDLVKKFELLKSKGVDILPKDMAQFADKIKALKVVSPTITPQLGGIAPTDSTAAPQPPKGAFATPTPTTASNTEGVVANLPQVAAPEMGTMKDKIGSIILNSNTAYAAFRGLQEPIAGVIDQLDDMKNTAVDAFIQMWSGDFSGLSDSLMSIYDTGIDVFNELRYKWDFVKEGFTASKDVFKDVWSIITVNGGNALSTIKTMGLTFLTETLPSLLTFVGQGVVSMASYVLSLVGATTAQGVLNAVMLANPIGLIIVGIVAVGVAVAALVYYWEDVKNFIVGFGNFFVEHNPFAWLMGLVDSFLPNFRNSVFAIFTSIKDFIYEHFVKYFQGVIDWFKSQYESIVGKVQEATQATVAPPESPAIVPEASIAPTKQAKAVTQRKSLDLGVSQKEKAITGSGAQVKNITINIVR